MEKVGGVEKVEKVGRTRGNPVRLRSGNSGRDHCFVVREVKGHEGVATDSGHNSHTGCVYERKEKGRAHWACGAERAWG